MFCIQDFQLRLVSEYSNYEGVLEMYLDERWGVICSHPGWDIRAASVACHQMGVGSAISTRADFSVPYNTPATLRHVVCEGSELELLDCQHEIIDGSSCRPVGAVRVQCNPFTSQPMAAGMSLLRATISLL